MAALLVLPSSLYVEMVFSSLLFLFWFIPIFFAVYYLCPAKCRNAVLFLGSIVFYAWGEPAYLILIFISILVNYAAGLGLRADISGASRSPSEKLIYVFIIPHILVHVQNYF